MKLAQAVALLKGAKNARHSTATAIYAKLQRKDEFNGMVRTYTPVDDDGDTRPDEVKVVQSRAPELLADAANAIGKLFDMQAMVDYGNTVATADVVVGGNVLIEKAPVPYLLFLEKQLKDWVTILRTIPPLDPAKQWIWGEDRGEFFTEGTVTNSPKKTTQYKVVIPPTDKHPGQIREYDEDITVGRWKTVYRSGAMHPKDVRALLARAEELSEAVKVAREEANSKEVASKRGLGKKVFDYLLGA